MRPAARFIRPVVRDRRVCLAVLDVDLVGPIGVRLAAARSTRIIRLHQRLIPLANGGICRLPLSEIAGICNAKHATERQTEDNAIHSALLSFSSRDTRSNVRAANQLRLA